uniref:MKL/myocardin-like protein 2 n=1 Tax=Hydra vulgaris TaxID=6087 RepID=T2M3Y4_HYDVU
MEQKCIFNHKTTNLHSAKEIEEDMTVSTSKRQRTSPSLDNLFSNKEVLARRLKHRPDRVSLIERHIIPAQLTNPGIYDKVTQLERRKTSDFLQKKIRVRPSRNQLVQRHILTDTKADGTLLQSLTKLERQRIADHLSEHLLQRPGPLELIQEKILSVESPIQNALKEVSFENLNRNVAMISELESKINTLKCAPSPNSPLQSPLLHKNFFEAVQVSSTSNLISDLNKKDHQKEQLVKPISNEFPNISNELSNQIQFKDFSTNTLFIPTQISLSQKENDKLIKALATKKFRPQKQRVKKLKFHECRPADMHSLKDNHIDERYQSLLDQQTLYLRLQVMQQNAMLNAIQGNTDNMVNVTEKIESVVEKDTSMNSKPAVLLSLDGKNLEEMRVIELRAHLKQRGLLVSGSKARLIQRLLAYEEGHSSQTDYNRVKDSLLLTSPENSSCLSISNSSVLQVTTYSTAGGKTYQLIYAVPNQSIPEYQISQTSFAPTQQVQHIIQPLVSYAKIDDVKTGIKTIFPKSSEPSLQLPLSGSSTIIYQQPHYVSEKTIVPHYYQSNGVTYMMPQHISVHPSANDLGQLSQSVPTTIKYSNDYIISPTIVNISDSFKVSNVKNDQLRERSFSEPHKPNSYISNLNENKQTIKDSASTPLQDINSQKDQLHTQRDVFLLVILNLAFRWKSENVTDTYAGDKLSVAYCQNFAYNVEYPPTVVSAFFATATNCMRFACHQNGAKSNSEIDDIIDIIGELSRPSSPVNKNTKFTTQIPKKCDPHQRSSSSNKKNNNFTCTQQSNFFSISDILSNSDNFETISYNRLDSHCERKTNHSFSSRNGDFNDNDQLLNNFEPSESFPKQDDLLGNNKQSEQMTDEVYSEYTSRSSFINSPNTSANCSNVAFDSSSPSSSSDEIVMDLDNFQNNSVNSINPESNEQELSWVEMDTELTRPIHFQTTPSKEILIDNPFLDMSCQSHSNETDHPVHLRNEYMFNGIDQSEQFVSLFELESCDY